eukprot:m.39890 g.39890  ORF g.39890 m.39890 type:complete len:643 (-) comp6894_c0_seq2:1647-3575(-)
MKMPPSRVCFIFVVLFGIGCVLGTDLHRPFTATATSHKQQQLYQQIVVNWEDIIALSNTTTTLQVVANPLLNEKTCPVAARAFESLAALNADMVRYVPWFPYPKVGVAELDPPNYSTKATSWNFEDITPQLFAFMNATYGNGHTVVPNFSTQPTWMYDTNDWSYPTDPNTCDFQYPRGNANANTTELVAAYYARLLSWLVKGEFDDEFGVRHTGGPKYNLTHWEVFNEPQGCHGLTMEGYNEQYDAVVTAIREAADPEHRIKFVGLAASGSPLDWISYFLDPNNHKAGIPRDYVSFHFYANCPNRTDPQNYENFFVEADGFLLQAHQIASVRASLSPGTKISCDEMGVILPDDNVASPVPFPKVYWNAAGAMYAYLVGELTKVGFEVLGQSQLAGTPPQPQWDIHESQYPSVSLLDWTTGEGNGRYWVLKMLIEEFGPGDHLVNTSIPIETHSTLCAKVDGHSGYANVSLSCADENAVINSIDFASFGTPTGICGNYSIGSCNSANSSSIVKQMCIGKRSCSILSYPTFGDPCYGVFKSLVVQATCSDGNGIAMPPDYSSDVDVYAQGYITKDGTKKILIVNKKYANATVTLATSYVHPSNDAFHATLRVVDEATQTRPPRTSFISSPTITLAPFAVAVVIF